MEYQEWLRGLSGAERKYAPVELFCAGDAGLLWRGRCVSVVGTRDPSGQGVVRTRKLVELLVDLDLVVCSGLARGVDTVAHESAVVRGGKTFAVLPTPLGVVTPKSNEGLYSELVANHLVVSQFPEGSGVNKGNFVRRNRTMALLSDATVVVEASNTSGTRFQALEALRLGRRLFLLESLALDKEVVWAQEVLRLGAEVLTRENAGDLLGSLGPSRFRVG